MQNTDRLSQIQAHAAAARTPLPAPSAEDAVVQEAERVTRLAAARLERQARFDSHGLPRGL